MISPARAPDPNPPADLRQPESTAGAIDVPLPAPRGAAAPSTRSTRVARNVAMVLLSQMAIWIAGSGLAIILPR